MASTPQKMLSRLSQPENRAYEELFGNTKDISSAGSASATFTKRLFVIAFSSVAYLRDFLPESAFSDRYVGDLHLKIIKEGGSPLTHKFIERVQACFDAIEKGYLRTVSVWIYLDPKNRRESIEAYIFKFTYSSNQANITLSRNNKELAQIRSGDDIHEATVSLLKTLVIKLEKLEPLPERAYLEMQLTYIQGTPKEYEPAGFRPAPEKIVFTNPCLEIGTVATNHHTLDIQLSVAADRFGPHKVHGAELESLYGTDMGGSSDDEQMAPSGSSESNFEVACICGGDRDGKMIRCLSCSKLQHAICYGMFPGFERREFSHFCVSCASKDDVRGTCFDESLLKFSAVTLKQKALFRRAVLAASIQDLTVITRSYLCNRLNVGEEEAQGIIGKMVDLKLARQSGEEQSVPSFTVDMPALKRFLDDAAEKIFKRQIGSSSSEKPQKKNRATKRKANEECEV